MIIHSEVSLMLSDLEDVVEGDVRLTNEMKSRIRSNFLCYISFKAPLNSFHPMHLQCQKSKLFLIV